MSSSSSLPPLAGITPPSSPLLESALVYVREHTSRSTANHCIRSAYWAMLLAQRLRGADAAPLSNELLVYVCLMHDLGWATTKELLSRDKRFEVDGADLAVRFLAEHPGGLSLPRETVWTAIALHTTPSIGHHHPDPHVGAVQLGIMADFFGPAMPSPPFPPGLISVDEYRAVVGAFPRDGFKDGFVQIMCGLCRDKPDTTYDNFVSDFGKLYGTDGKGGGKEAYAQEWEKHVLSPQVLAGLDACAEYE